MRLISPFGVLSTLALIVAPGSGCTLEVDPVASPEGVKPAWWGAPIVADEDLWTWVDFPDTRCADGSPTGLAINPSPAEHPSGTVLYMEGGGACWNAVSCGFHWGDLGLALHLEGYDQSTWESLWGDLYSRLGLFNREDPTNPFRDAHFVFLPYCTGDVFAGRRVTTFEGLHGKSTTYHFTGHLNFLEYLERLVPTFHDTERVWLIGSSAGGFGAELGWPVAQERFGDVRVDVISDSGQPIDPPEKTWEAWREAWDLWLPPDCADCDQGPRRIIDHYLASGLIDPNRYGLIVFERDVIISLFFGLSQDEHAAQVDSLLTEVFDDPSVVRTESAFYFARPGAFHTSFLLGWDFFGAEDVPLREWLTMFVEDDPALRSVRAD